MIIKSLTAELTALQLFFKKMDHYYKKTGIGK